MSAPLVSKSTPILLADRIEPSLAFWEKLGFKRLSEVPAGDHLAFAILTNGNVEIMYETLESLAGEAPHTREAAAMSKAFLYLEVPDLSAVKRALAGVPIYSEERQMFYGATEMAWLDPAGNFITFAQFAR